jgi:hypothetical protein
MKWEDDDPGTVADKECIQNVGRETSLKTATWKTEEMRRKHQILGKWVVRRVELGQDHVQWLISELVMFQCLGPTVSFSS